MRRVLVIAGLTLREARGQVSVRLLLAAGVVAMLLLPALSVFAIGRETLLAKQLGFSTMALVTLLLVLLGAASAIRRELEERTTLMLLAKPVSRGELLAGKYAGLAIGASIAIAAMSVALLLSTVALHATFGASGTDTWRQALANEQAEPNLVDDAGPDPAADADEAGTAGDSKGGSFSAEWRAAIVVGLQEAPSILIGSWLTFCQILVLAAVLVAGSVVLAPAANAALGLAVLLLGHMSDWLVLSVSGGREPDGVGAFVAQAAFVWLPNLRMYDAGEWLAAQGDAPVAVEPWMLGATLLALAYSGAILWIAGRLLSRRDLG